MPQATRIALIAARDPVRAVPKCLAGTTACWMIAR